MKINTLQVQRGLSLIELMIGLLLASVLLLGVLQVFDANRRTSNLQTAFSNIQERGRLATDMLARELRNAAFTGCVSGVDQINSHLDASNTNHLTGVHDYFSSGEIIGGTDDAKDGDKIGGASGTAIIKDTDTLMVRGAVDACGGVGRVVDPVTPGTLEVSSDCDLPVGEVAMVANCLAADVFTISSLSSGVVGFADTVPDGKIPNSSVTLAQSYGGEARIYLPYTREYFIAEGASGERGLYVRDNGKPVQELIPGVEDMQFLYGRDTSGDGSPNIWSGSFTSAQSAEVVAVRMQVLIAAEDNVNADDFDFTPLGGAETTFTDKRLRKEFTATTKLRNRGSK